MITNFNPTETIVYINCCGKSGSTTLFNTFSKYYTSLQTHGDKNFKQRMNDNEICLYDCIKTSMKHNENVYIIDSYRTPFERAISATFENNSDTSLNNFNYDNLILENYNCFDETLYAFGLELPNSFDFEKKHIYIKHNNLHIIKLRFSDINYWDKILSNIFNHEILLTASNLSIDKTYYDNYINVLKNLKIPKNLFECLINSKDFKFYNSSEEQNRYIKNWIDRVDSNDFLIENIPFDFNPVHYKNTYDDLINMSDLEAVIHYKYSGCNEGRKYK